MAVPDHAQNDQTDVDELNSDDAKHVMYGLLVVTFFDPSLDFEQLSYKDVVNADFDDEAETIPE